MSDGPKEKDDSIDATHLQSWLERALHGFHGPLTIKKLEGGQSNPTYLLRTPRRKYVLRSQPPGEIAGGAHAVDREYRAMHALDGQIVPVPKVRILCEDPAIIGRSFYVMDFVDGDILWQPDLPDVRPENRPKYFDAMNRTLADLHNVDPAAVGLNDFGRAENYLSRQIHRWRRQYRADERAGRIERMDRMADWLAANTPDSTGVSIVHGDFRINNLMFKHDRPEVAAVLDWELSTIGDPVTDFAFHLMMYRVPSGIQGGGLKGLNLSALNLPSETDYILAYCERTGRTSIPDLQFHIAFNLFRFAAIIHGIKGRALRGTASSRKAHEVASALDIYVNLAWDETRRAGMQ